MYHCRPRVVHLPDGRGQRLEWYSIFVYNRSVAGSLFTLVHVPFMVAFLSMTIIGAEAAGAVDVTVLGLSLAVVAMLLYAEHLLDETTRVGKPWNTVLGDGALFALASLLFLASLIAAAYAMLRYGTGLPVVGVVAGILFTTLYGLEVKGFHTTGFGGVGMGAVAPFSYLAQTLMLGLGWSPVTAVLLLVFGSSYGYVLLSVYESTKGPEYHAAWRLLFFVFIIIYALAAFSIPQIM